MKISTKGRYALRLMIYLANNKGNYVSLNVVSLSEGISIKYLEQIIAILNRAGYVRSLRGNNGGYMLSKDPSEYKIGDILRLTEGSLCPISCLEGEYNECKRKDICKTLSFWKGLNDVIDKYVDNYTLQDFIDNSFDYCI